MKTRDRMVWIDFETDGLEIESGNIPLELGMRVTLFSNPRVILSQQTLLLYQPGATDMALRRLQEKNTANQFVAEMHRRSGLLADLNNPALRRNLIMTADFKTAQERFISLMQWEQIEGEPLCGSSVDFDRSFLQAYFPLLAKMFHYRVIDISTIKMMAEKTGFDKSKLPIPGKKHRPQPDISDTIEEMLAYRKEGLCP